MQLMPIQDHIIKLLISVNIITLCTGELSELSELSEGQFHFSYPGAAYFNTSIEANGGTWYFQTDSGTSFINFTFTLTHENGSDTDMSIHATEYWAEVLHTLDFKMMNDSPTVIPSWKESEVFSCCENFRFTRLHIVNDGNVIWSQDHDAIAALRIAFKDNMVSLYVMMGVCAILVIMVLVLIVILLKWTGQDEKKTRRTSTIIPFASTSF